MESWMSHEVSSKINLCRENGNLEYYEAAFPISFALSEVKLLKYLLVPIFNDSGIRVIEWRMYSSVENNKRCTVTTYFWLHHAAL